ncbi:MAG: hypothetical protein IJ511_07745 [Bacteroides sp.]|nr:hypothetical protein [Bacteroides sp.]
MRGKRFQNRVTTGRLTLPAAIFMAVIGWVTAALVLPFHSDTTGRIGAFLLYGLTGYLLVVLNNAFAFIRMRASVQTAVYFLLTASCPMLHQFQWTDLQVLCFLPALFFLFRSYQRPAPMGDLFHAFVFIGAGSLLSPKLTLLVPVFWIGAYSFQSLRIRSFLASLLGWFLPYWFLLVYACWQGQMELFCRPFRELADFPPADFAFLPWQWATLGYLLLLYVVSVAHCLATGYEDKIRTRAYLNFLSLLCLVLFAGMLLMPPLFGEILPLVLATAGILYGHLFALSNSRLSNVFFICALVGLLLLFGYNVWTLL